MTEKDVSTISPLEAQAKMKDGAALLDVREYPEFAGGRLPGARCMTSKHMRELRIAECLN